MRDPFFIECTKPGIFPQHPFLMPLQAQHPPMYGGAFGKLEFGFSNGVFGGQVMGVA